MILSASSSITLLIFAKTFIECLTCWRMNTQISSSVHNFNRAARLPENNVTGNVSKSDEVIGVSKLDESFAVIDRTRPVVELAQAVGSGGEPMTAEARRQYVNLKRVRYQGSNSRTERGQMLRELVDDGIYKNIKSANRAMLETEEIGSRIHDRGRKPIYTEATKVGLNGRIFSSSFSARYASTWKTSPNRS